MGGRGSMFVVHSDSCHSSTPPVDTVALPSMPSLVKCVVLEWNFILEFVHAIYAHIAAAVCVGVCICLSVCLSVCVFRLNQHL